MSLSGTPTTRLSLPTFADTDSPDLNGNLDLILNAVDAVLPVVYRVGAKTVNTTTTATDLLNGAVTLPAGILGTTRLLRLSATGDWLNNSGGAAAPPRFQLILGATTLLDTGTSGSNTNAAGRAGWDIEAKVGNTTASAQWSNLKMMLTTNSNGTTTANAFTTGEGYYGRDTTNIVCLAEGSNSTTVATAGALALVLNVINGSANAAYETKLFGAVVEIL